MDITNNENAANDVIRQKNADGLYRALISLRIHHDRVLWSRVQLLLAVQGAVVGGLYAVGDHRLSSIFLFAGAVLSLVIYELVTKDQLNRDANDHIINPLGDQLIPKEIVAQLLEQRQSRPFISLSADAPKWRPFVRGRYLIRIVILAFTFFDIALAILHYIEKAPILRGGN